MSGQKQVDLFILRMRTYALLRNAVPRGTLKDICNLCFKQDKDCEIFDLRDFLEN
jgi:hypothetical protein